MKLTVILMLLFVSIGVHEVSAQRGLPGQVGVSVSVGPLDGILFRDSRMCYRYWGSVDVVRYTRRHRYWNFSSTYQHKDYPYEGVCGNEAVPIVQITADAGYNMPLVYDRARNVSLVGGLGVLAGYEVSRSGDKLLADGATLMNKDGFVYGLVLTAAVEGYLSDRVMLMLKVRERCAFGASTGVFHTQLGLGLRFVIN